MKKILLLLAASLFLMTSCTENKENLVSRIIKETKTHSSEHFKVTERYYYSDAPDTTVTSFEVWALRDKTDSLRNGYVRVNDYYRPYSMIYDAGNFYLSIPPKKTTVRYKNYKKDFISPVDWIDVFLKPGSLKALVTQPKTKTTISDTTYQGKNCAKIEIQFPNEAKKYVFVVDKMRLVPLWSKMVIKQNGLVYSHKFFFSDYTFDKVNLGKLKAEQKKILADNPIIDESENSEVALLERMLHVGDKAPLVTGKFYSSDNEFHLADYIGKKVIIVDFWYSHCPPCVRSMPALSKLYTEYKNKGLVIFGLNSVDNHPRSLDHLKTFLRNRQISYNIVLTKSTVDVRYKINDYPTMYIINKEGKIVYADNGFNQEKLSRLREKVKQLIQ